MISLVNLGYWGGVFATSLNSIGMQSGHLLPLCVFTFLTLVFTAQPIIPIVFRVILIDIIILSPITKLGIIYILEPIVLILFLETQFRVLLDMLVVLFWLVCDYVVVVSLLHENVLLVKFFYQ